MNTSSRILNNIEDSSTKNFNTNNKVNNKLSNGSDKQKETIQQIGLYGFNIESDKFVRINSTNQGVLEMENSSDNKRGFGQVLLTAAGGTAVKGDTSCTVQEDPEHRVGWNLTNDIGGTKFNLYYFNGTQEIITLESVTSIYAKAFINVNNETASMPFFHIYTKPTGVGDAGVWYHSKIDYMYNVDNVIGIGEECIFYGIAPPTTSFSNRQIQFNNKVVTGDGDGLEEILYMVFSSDSGATINSVNVTANLLGFDTGSINRNLNLISESSLTGGATEANQILSIASTDAIKDRLPVSIGQKANSGSLSTTRSTTIGTYDLSARTTIGTAGTSTNLLCDALGKLQVDVVGGVGGDATAANQALQLAQAEANAISVNNIDNKITQGADTTLTTAQQVLIYGEVTSGPGIGELHPIHITNAGDVEVEIADFVKGQDIMAASFPVVIASDQSTLPISVASLPLPSGAATETTLSALNTKVTTCNTGAIVGSVTVSSSDLPLGAATETTLSALNTKVTKGSDATLTEAQQVVVYGCDAGGTLRPQKMTSSGLQQVEVEGARANGNQIGWTIADGATATSTPIQMGGNTRIAFYGDTDNTFNANFHIQYSQDNVNWFRGSDDNSKVIIVSATGNFYDEEIITPPRVRLTRTNNSGSLETINLYWTRV